MKEVLEYVKKNKFPMLIILPAFFLYMLVIFPSGTFFCFKDACGINFWGVHGHDAIWHLAIANVSFNKFPFVAPTFSGESLYGYNYLLDFFIYLLSKLGIPAIISYFKLLPVVWFILFTCLLIILGRKIKDDPKFVGLFVFFNYFAGSFYYLIKLYREGSINDSSAELPQPVMITMSNPPFAFSLLFLLWILIILKEKKITFRNILFIGISIFFILGLKFYSIVSVFLVIVFIFLSLFTSLRSSFHEKNKKIFLSKVRHEIKMFTFYLFTIGIFVVLAILLFYDPVRSFKTGSVFGFAPFALVHTITETPTMFYLQNMTDARYYLIAHGIGPRLIVIELLNLTIFLFFYLGTRFFGLLYIPILLLKRKLDKFDFSVILTICFSIFLTITLVQKAEWWNTIQFFYYAIFLLTIYLAKLTYDLTENKKLLLNFIVLTVMFLSIPTTYDMIKFFLGPGATYISKNEIDALNFLKRQPDGIVLTPLYNKQWKNYIKTNEIYTYEDTAYLAAFSGKQTYFANILQLRLTGVSYERRLERLKRMDCSVLNEVDYVYEISELENKDKIMIKCKAKNAKKIYSNGKIFIYSITK